MPNPNDKNEGSIAGAFYVDSTCIDCDMCRENAPEFFRRNDETGYTIVYRQPLTPSEIARANEAREHCPTESIGSDGLPWKLAEST